MTAWQLLEWSYPIEKICPGRMWEDIIGESAETLDGYEAFRGHFLAYLEPFLGRKFQTFTILRDPVERTISHYYHVQRAPEHPFHADALRLSLAEFCVHERTRHMVQNYQTAYLACPGRKAPQELARSMTKEDLDAYKLQLALDPTPNEHPRPEELFQAATDRLQGFVAVGITEAMDETLKLIARALSLPHPPKFLARNVSNNRQAITDPSTINLIRANTELDHALYRAAKDALECKIGELEPPHSSR